MISFIFSSVNERFFTIAQTVEGLTSRTEGSIMTNSSLSRTSYSLSPVFTPIKELKARAKPCSESKSGLFGNISTLISFPSIPSKSVPSMEILSFNSSSDSVFPISFSTTSLFSLIDGIFIPAFY